MKSFPNIGAEGFTSIFDGKSFDGWKGPVENYEIKDGALGCLEGKGGTIYWGEEQKDFIARVEFRLPPGGNNGLAIRYSWTGRHRLHRYDGTSGFG
jgi:hypothetical protein